MTPTIGQWHAQALWTAVAHLLSDAGGLLSGRACLCRCRPSAEPLCMSEQFSLVQAVTALEGTDSGALSSPAESPAREFCTSRLAAGSACGEAGFMPAWQHRLSAKDHSCALLHVYGVSCLSASSTAPPPH